MGYPQDENGVKTSSFNKLLIFEHAENKDVLDVEDSVGHWETRLDFLLLFCKKRWKKKKDAIFLFENI